MPSKMPGSRERLKAKRLKRKMKEERKSWKSKGKMNC